MSDDLQGLNPVGRGSHPERAYGEKKKSIGIILPGIETKQIKYEQVLDAQVAFKGYAETLKKLGKEIPEHIKIALKILSFIEPMYGDFHPRGG